MNQEQNQTQIPVSLIEQSINFYRNRSPHNSIEISLDEKTKSLIETYGLMIYQRANFVEASDLQPLALDALNHYLQNIGKELFHVGETSPEAVQNGNAQGSSNKAKKSKKS